MPHTTEDHKLFKEIVVMCQDVVNRDDKEKDRNILNGKGSLGH